MAAAPDAGEAPAIDTGPLEQHVRGLDRGLERVDKLQVKWEAATLALDEMEKESVARSIYGKNDTMYRDLQRRVETAIRTKETLATSLSSAQESLASTQRRLETAERMATERAVRPMLFLLSISMRLICLPFTFSRPQRCARGTWCAHRCTNRSS
jgi:hypothetical protein